MDRNTKTGLCVRGVDLSSYHALLFFPDTVRAYIKLGRARLLPKLAKISEKYLGQALPVEVTADDTYAETRSAPHEILFGGEFRRDGIPAVSPKKSYYGVTEDGTIYFHSPSIVLFFWMWEQFLREFAPLGSVPTGIRREIPDFDFGELEKAGYRKVFDDDFDGEKLDMDVWAYRGVGANPCCSVSGAQAHVENGSLVLEGSYREDGEFGPGWYCVSVMPKKRYCRGYFEARIRCSECRGRGGDDFWSAFWIQGSSPYKAEDSQGGVGPGGCEIDILENFGRDYTTSCFWVAGMEGEDDISGELYEVKGLGDDFVDEYHTYGCVWDETCYRVYVDGMLIACTDHGYGTSRVEEQVIFSMCCPNEITLDRSVKRSMYVDYLRIWQK